MDAREQAQLAAIVGAAFPAVGWQLVVPMQAQGPARQTLERAATLDDCAKAVGVLYRAGFRLRPAPGSAFDLAAEPAVLASGRTHLKLVEDEGA